MSEEETGETNSSKASEICAEEVERRKTRERNMKKYKMVRTKEGLRYEEDLTVQEKKQLHEDKGRYRHTHVGRKLVEVSLIPSARLGNSEANKAKMLRYVHSKGYNVTEVRDRGYARLELIFDDCTKANRCLEDKDSQEMVFEIPGRAKICKGVIIGWDLECTLVELIDAMVNLTGVVSVERLMRKRYDRESKKVEVSASHVVAMTWEGSELQSEIKIYEGLLGLRVRSFIDRVLQCFCCFRFGHLAKHCKRRPVCKVCGEDFHGRCDQEYKCSNCGGRHMPTNRSCETY